MALIASPFASLSSPGLGTDNPGDSSRFIAKSQLERQANESLLSQLQPLLLPVGAATRTLNLPAILLCSKLSLLQQSVCAGLHRLYEHFFQTSVIFPFVVTRRGISAWSSQNGSLHLIMTSLSRLGFALNVSEHF